MSARLVVDGLEELRAALQRLPEELVNESAGIVTEEADAFAVDLEGAYPFRSGKLRKGVRVTRTRVSDTAAIAAVRNVNPLAHIFERGTQARHTKIGADRGAMPPGRVFIPRAIRYKRQMIARVARAVEGHGLTVTIVDD